MTKPKKIQFSITLGALAVAIVHLLWPGLKIDAVTVALVTIATLPWLAPLFKSIEIPGLVKVEFAELEQAKQEAESAGLLAKPSLPTPQDHVTPSEYPFAMIQTLDSNLALAGLRIEIERRLAALARKYGVETNRYGINWLLSTLRLRRVLTQEEELVLERLAKLLNAAVHGAEVDPRGAAWAAQVGPALLEALDQKIKKDELLEGGI